MKQFDNNEVAPALGLSVAELYAVEKQCQNCKSWDMDKGCMLDGEPALRPIQDCGEFNAKVE